jgi:hypothetical protein
MRRVMIFVLTAMLGLGLASWASAEANPLIDLLKQKGVVTPEEAGKVEKQLDEYYKQKAAQAPAAAVQPAPAPAAPAKEAAAPKPEEKGRRNRVNWGGEGRFRVMDERGDAPTAWGGNRVQLASPTLTAPAGGGAVTITSGAASLKTIADAVHQRGISEPLRMRLNFDAQVIPDFVDVWGRFTINKRWGTFSQFPEQDPFNAPNSFAASIGSGIALGLEEFYMTMRPPSCVPGDWLLYVGRLPGMDGAPSRQDRSIFPRIFIDSEIDGALLRYGLPALPTAKDVLPCGPCPVAEFKESLFRGGPMNQYERKVAETNAVYVGYLDYNESKLSSPSGKVFTGDVFTPIVGHGPSSDVYLAQVQVKPLKDTQFVLDGLWMPNWYMPRSSFDPNGDLTTQSINPVFSPTASNGSGAWTPGLDIPFFTSDYYLYGAYLDTQLLGFQIYGDMYFDILRVPGFSYRLLQPNGTGGSKTLATVNYDGNKFEGYMWHVGMNTGSWLAKYNMSFCTEYSEGSKAWINPFNYRGYRRKGTDLYPQANSFFGGNSIVGFYPLHAKILDTYLDYYWSKVRFRAGVMWYWHQKEDVATITTTGTPAVPVITGGPDRILGMSRYQENYWPYFEINVSF